MLGPSSTVSQVEESALAALTTTTYPPQDIGGQIRSPNLDIIHICVWVDLGVKTVTSLTIL